MLTHHIRRNSTDGAEMVWVPGGRFRYGEEGGRRQLQVGQSHPLPPGEAHLTGFWIYRYEVTNEMYRSFLAVTGYKSQPAWWTTDLPKGDVLFPRPVGEPHPELWEQVRRMPAFVRWRDAAAYAEWAKARLPSELEWERAARGTPGRRFPWGNRYLPSLVAKPIYGPVDAYVEDVSPYGAVGMFTGSEWTGTRMADGSVIVRGSRLPLLWYPGSEDTAAFWAGRSIAERVAEDPDEYGVEDAERFGVGWLMIGFRCVVSPGAAEDAPRWR